MPFDIGIVVRRREKIYRPALLRIAGANVCRLLLWCGRLDFLAVGIISNGFMLWGKVGGDFFLRNRLHDDAVEGGKFGFEGF